MNQKLFFIATLLVSIFCSGQIKVYTPGTSTKSKTDNSYKWVVKTDVFSYVSGEFPFALEYRIAPKMSVEASAGFTYAFLPNESLFGNDDDSSYESEAALGSAFRASLKYYPSSDYDAIEGWYFGLQFFNKTLNRNYVSASNNIIGFPNGIAPNSSIIDKKNSKVKTGFSILIGKQIFQDSNIALESYIGIGLANVSRKYYTTKFDISNNAYVSPESSEKSSPNFQIGFKIGFGN